MVGRGLRAGLVVGLVALFAVGCGGGPVKPSALADPCALVTDQVLAVLAPGSPLVPTESLGDISGSKRCEADLADGRSGRGGDLLVSVAVDGVDMYDDGWRNDQCGRIHSHPSESGPGDVSCLATQPWDGVQTRVDGLAWISDDYEVRVGYQLVDPHELPTGVETTMRDLLAAAVESLPV